MKIRARVGYRWTAMHVFALAALVLLGCTSPSKREVQKILTDATVAIGARANFRSDVPARSALESAALKQGVEEYPHGDRWVLRGSTLSEPTYVALQRLGWLRAEQRESDPHNSFGRSSEPFMYATVTAEGDRELSKLAPRFDEMWYVLLCTTLIADVNYVETKPGAGTLKVAYARFTFTQTPNALGTQLGAECSAGEGLAHLRNEGEGWKLDSANRIGG